jgi:hypothetical protein
VQGSCAPIAEPFKRPEDVLKKKVVVPVGKTRDILHQEDPRPKVRHQTNEFWQHEIPWIVGVSQSSLADALTVRASSH